MRPLRICQLVRDLDPAGPERNVYELVRRLDPQRYHVKVVALRGGAMAEPLAEAGVELAVLDVRGRWDLPKLSRLTDTLRTYGTDVLHTHLFSADLAGRPAARLAAVRHVVHTVHIADGRYRPWQFAYARFLANSCDRIVCTCESVRQLHSRRSGLPQWRYAVIGDGVDSDAFRRSEADRRRLRAEWGIGQEQILAAYVGQLDYAKGIDTLLAAFSHLGARGDPTDIVIAGDGSRRQAVENFIAHGEGGGCARLLGHVADRRAVLSAADLLIAPSRWEVWPVALAEAMAMGLSVIGTDVPGTRDVITDGQTGVLVGRNDAAGLAEAVLELAGDAERRRALGEAARRAAIEDHAIDAMVDAHEALYADVAADVLANQMD